MKHRFIDPGAGSYDKALGFRHGLLEPRLPWRGLHEVHLASKPGKGGWLDGLNQDDSWAIRHRQDMVFALQGAHMGRNSQIGHAASPYIEATCKIRLLLATGMDLNAIPDPFGPLNP